MNIDELYQTIILDHYREKHHSGLRDGYAIQQKNQNGAEDECRIRPEIHERICLCHEVA